jgi:hypothetical protein
MLSIVNQDRDKIIEIGEDAVLYTKPVYAPESGNLWGINLYAGDSLLGTFDSVNEALREMEMIRACEFDTYHVTGYYPDEDGEPESLAEAVLGSGDPDD